MQFEIHGCRFDTDTADWGNNQSDAEACADLIEEKAKASFTADEAAELHRLQLMAIEGEIDWDGHELLQRAEKIGSDAFLEITKDWESQPSLGHNSSFFAIQ